MKLVSLLPVLAIVFIAGCVGQTAYQAPSGQQPGGQEPAGQPGQVGPGTTEPATQPLPPPISSSGFGFVLVTPQPGQHIFTNDVSVVVAPFNFTLVAPGGAPKEREGHFHITLDSRPYVVLSGTSYVFTDVPTGNHTLRVEVHANDHSSLDPPLVRILYFTTGPAAPSGPTGCAYNNPDCPADFACEDNVCVSRGKQIGQ